MGLLPYTNWFEFKGVRSSTMGVSVERLPDIIKPERSVESSQIAGRSGTVYVDNNSYLNYTKSAECFITNIRLIDEMTSWLNGYGDVIFSNEPDKVYRAMVKNAIPFDNVVFQAKRFIVQFDCQPFKRSVNAANDTKTFTTGGVLFGAGNVDAAPVITVYGSGNITLTVNGERIALSGVSGYITVDSEFMSAYKGAESQNDKMAGSFPMLTPGRNTIEFSGSVSRVVVAPNWRWI